LWISSQPDCLATVLYMLSVSSIGCSANPEWYFFVDICSHNIPPTIDSRQSITPTAIPIISSSLVINPPASRLLQ